MTDTRDIQYDSAPVLIAAGGTGGHVYPALAVAEVLRSRQVPVIWLGTHAGIEATVVKEAGFSIEWVSVTGLRGKNFLDTLMAPLKLIRSLFQAWRVFQRCKPRAVLGMGGFVAGPGSIIALLRRRPLIIHEQNSVAGLTNRLLCRFAKRVFTAFPNVFKSPVNEENIGNPVREEIFEIENPEKRLQASGSCKVLVVGGSRGARFLNQLLPDAMKLCGMDYELLHQTGKADLDETRHRYESTRCKVDVTAYIDSMADAYSWADLVICRAGAMTVSELTAAGLASVLVPYPYAVDNHQTHNALWLVQSDAAIILQESELSPAVLAGQLDELAANREKLLAMSVNARRLYKSDAAESVADALLEV